MWRCTIKNLLGLGTVEEFRDNLNLHTISHCFMADIEGDKGSPNMDEGELAAGCEPVWMSLADAIRTLESEDREHYEGSFMRKRDLFILKEVVRLIGSPHAKI